jgi:hypothetical protein
MSVLTCVALIWASLNLLILAVTLAALLRHDLLDRAALAPGRAASSKRRFVPRREA